MKRAALACFVAGALALGGGLAIAQTVVRRVTFAQWRTPVTSTVFQGIADRAMPDVGKTTYEGNVVIKFPDSQVVIKADKATWDAYAKALTFDGPVRVELDVK